MVKIDYLLNPNKSSDIKKIDKADDSFFLNVLIHNSDINLRLISNISDINIDNIILSNDIDVFSLVDFIEPSYGEYPYVRRDYIHRLLETYKINTPKTIVIDFGNGIDLEYLVVKLKNANFDLDNDNELTIRKIKTARSLGNLTIPINKLSNFIDLLIDIACNREKSSTKDIQELARKNGIQLPDASNRGYWRKKEELESLETYLAGSSKFTIQEVIPNIVEEYRLFYHAGINTTDDIRYVVNRTGFSLNPKKEEMGESTIYIQKDKKLYKRLKPILEKIIHMCKEQKLLTASFDIYVDSNINVGCFEFSTEYSMDGLSPKDISIFIDDLKDGLKNYGKIKRELRSEKENL